MVTKGVSANRLELLQIAEAVAREKSIDRNVVIEAMEDAVQKAAKSRYGSENEIQAKIDPGTGEIKLSRLLEVVEEVSNEATQITLKTAKRIKKDAELGDVLDEELPPLDFGRVAAQNAKQVIVQKVRDAERERQFDEYKSRIGEVANGSVRRIEYGNIIVDLGRAEAIIRRDESLPRENFRYGDRVRAFIYDVRREQRRVAHHVPIREHLDHVRADQVRSLPVPGKPPDQCERLGGREPAHTRCPRPGRVCGVDAVDVERQVRLVVPELVEERVDPRRPLAPPLLVGDELDPVILRVREVVFRVQGPFHTDAQHAPRIEDALLDRSDER